MNNENIIVMNATAKSLKDLILKRMNKRIEALKAFESPVMESLPDSVKMIREQQAIQLRAVVTEQSDLIEIIQAMYPDA